MVSTLPSSCTVTSPPASPPPLGFGPQAAPQSPTRQDACIALADHFPVEPVELESARAAPERRQPARSAPHTAVESVRIATCLGRTAGALVAEGRQLNVQKLIRRPW